MSHSRTQARERVLRVLYQLDLREDLKPGQADALLEEASEESWRGEAKQFASALLAGVLRERDAVDAELSGVAKNWELRRMAAVDRNVLRLGAYELMFDREQVPPAVAIDEAVNLAKRYSGKESGGFVNGILDKVYRRAEQRATESPEPSQ
ncbi:MAG: transcription antitermination factor NusB [Planctomycetes bacterium]|nr:transcription antitermination factor NusB [Planctomycetota bacterium]